MAAAFDSVRQAYAGISPRERRLVVALGVSLALLGVFGLWFFSSTVVSELEAERARMVEALRTIRNERPRIRERQRARDELLARYATPAPALTSFVEGAAREAHVTVNEAADRPAQNQPNQRFARRAVSIRIRHVDLQSLVAFIERIEAAPFPVAVTSIRIRKRFGEQNSYDVDDMVITTWDRVERSATPARRTGGTTPSTAPNARETL